MQKNDCLLVGKLTKEYGTDGELILSCTPGLTPPPAIQIVKHFG
jgi:hypothetical protein